MGLLGNQGLKGLEKTFDGPEFFKIAQDMDILQGMDFNSREKEEAFFPGQGLRRSEIEDMVVVRETDQVESLQQGHVDDIVGGHVLLGAGGEGGVDMQVIVDFHAGHV
jgi:hypothetical protein